jgi:isocitrate dehydrogenase (NAD+)
MYKSVQKRFFGSIKTQTSLVQSDPLKASGTVYGGVHTVTLIPGDGVGLEMSTAVKTIFKAAGVPIQWEQFDLKGSSTDDTKLRQAMDSIRKNRVALKGISFYLL